MYRSIRDLHYGPLRVLNSVSFQKFHYLNSYPGAEYGEELIQLGLLYLMVKIDGQIPRHLVPT